MKKIIYLFLVAVALGAAGCGKINQKAKETVNESGKVVGKTATEFIDGVVEGVDKTLECEIIVSPNLKAKGLQTGKFAINNDTIGQNNLLTLYIIFNKDFNNTMLVKVTDKNNLEIGRAQVQITAKANQAQYFDFNFDKRTYIEKRSKIYIDEIG